MRLALIPLVVALAACEESPKEPAPSRFAAVKKAPSTGALASFCDLSYASGRPFTAPEERPIPGVARAKASAGAWTWVNLWATWCGPCVEEMPLLERWAAGLGKEGVVLDLDLWSVDEEAADLTAYLAKNRVPGRVRHFADPEALPAFLEHLGVERDAAIPIHALVDPKGRLRCVRVGKVIEASYPAVKAILLAD